jgi:capsular exopolysaccharide synthesis family protein
MSNQRSDADNASQDQTQSSLVGSEGDYLKAKQHVAILEERFKELSAVLRPKHPQMVELTEDIDRQKSLLEIFKSQTQEQLSSREHALGLQIQNLDDQIQRWTASTLEISKKMADYTAIKERNLRLQTMYDNLLTSERTVDVERQINPQSVTILQAATPPSLVARNMMNQFLLFAILGLALGSVIVIVLCRLDDRPHSFTDLQDLFDETILGQIPHIRVKDKKVGVPILKEDDERHALAEAYRNLRSSLMFQGTAEKQPRIILVTSAIPGDGKSMTTANLAVMLARSGAKVLLVDADMRRGRVHKQFDLPSSPGLAEVLNEQRTWNSVVTQNSVPNLSVIARGTAPRHPGELLAKSMKEQFLKEAGGKYDFILLDSPPVMAADDVSNLTPYVDGVLMVIRANYTSGRVARAALDLLYMRKANVLGIVFNGVKSSGGDYYYYKYKEYYAATPAA